MVPENVDAVSDAELVERSRKGDQQAYGFVVQRYQSLVCSVAYNRCGDLALSEDFAQDAFLQAWKNMAGLRDTAPFKPWICTIVQNLATRARKRNPGVSPKTDVDAVSGIMQQHLFKHPPKPGTSAAEMLSKTLHQEPQLDDKASDAPETLNHIGTETMVPAPSNRTITLPQIISCMNVS